MNNLLVSVCCITFNHEKYIIDCINGFLNQNVNFDVEFLIHDDASTDKTQDIIKEMVGDDPRFNLILRSTNIKSLGKAIFPILYEKARGKYIALCEGDDYWTDPLKLQKQVDFLEANPDHGICFHKVNLIHPDGSITDDTITSVPESYQTNKDLASKGNYIHTPSVIFRRDCLIIPEEAYLSPIGDFFLYMVISRNRKIGYLQEVMGVYRVGSGIWSSQSDYERNIKTAYTFALLIKTKLFSKDVESILVQRIITTIKRFSNNISPKDLEKLSIDKAISLKIYDFLLAEIEKQKQRINQPFKKQIKNYIKAKLKL